MKNWGFTLLIVAITIILLQEYCFLQLDFLQINASIYYYGVVFFLLTGILIAIFRKKKKYILSGLFVLVIFICFKYFFFTFSNYQLDKNLANADKLINELNKYYEKNKSFPSNLTFINSKNTHYLIGIMPKRFNYFSTGEDYKLSFNSYKSFTYIYNSKYAKWTSGD